MILLTNVLRDEECLSESKLEYNESISVSFTSPLDHGDCRANRPIIYISQRQIHLTRLQSFNTTVREARSARYCLSGVLLTRGP